MNPKMRLLVELIFVSLVGGVAILAGINTSQQRQLVRLENAQANYENMISGIPSTALVVVNDRGEIVRWSRGAEQVFGWSFEEAVGRTVSDLLIPEKYARLHQQKLMSAIKNAATEGQSNVQHVSCMANTKDGKGVDIFLTASVGRGRYGRVWGFGIIHPKSHVRVLELKEP